MNMPGFAAEASLANPSEAYRVVRRFSDRDGQASVIPARRIVSDEFCHNMFVACVYRGSDVACLIHRSSLCDYE